MEYPIEKGKVIALIPARSGSKGVHNKNIREVAGHPLISYSIKVALAVRGIDRVIVSTDSLDYAVIAKSYGADVPFMRPKEISTDNSLDIEYIKHAIEQIGKVEKRVPEYIVLLRPTTPIRKVSDIESALEIIKENEAASAVVSATVIEECPFKWMKMNSDGYLSALFESMSNDDVNLPRQQFQQVYEPDGYVDVLRASTIMSESKVYGDNPIAFVNHIATVDIDSEDDIKMVQEIIALDS